MPRTMKILILSISLMVMCLTSVSAEEWGEARAAVGADLASKDPEKRGYAAERLAATGDERAVPLIMDALAKETDAFVGERMGRSLASLATKKALEQIEKRIKAFKGQKWAFQILWITQGVLLANDEEADQVIIRSLLELDNKRIFEKTALLEGIAVADRPDFHVHVAKFIGTYDKLFESNPLPLITACTTMSRISTNDYQYKIVLALAELMNAYENEKVKRFAASACGAIAREKPIISGDYWRYWALNEGKMDNEAPREGRTSTGKPKPKFFGTEAVGERIVFVIDNSGSMQAPISIRGPIPEKSKDPTDGPVTGEGKKDNDGEDKKDEVPPPDYSKVRTKLDLAKVELIHTLKQLDEDYTFNIVYYSTTHDHIIPAERGLVKATEANKQRFIKAVEALPVALATNIHGALMRGMRTTSKGEITKTDPAVSQTCILEGAETIFFLTDGVANVDDSSAAGAGTGVPPKFVETKNILADVARVNTFRKAVINTVGIGPHDRALLQGLARESGGDYRDMSGS